MRIAIGLESYFGVASAVQPYLEGLIPSLLRLAPDVTWTLFACAEYSERMSSRPFGTTPGLTYVPLSRRHRADRLGFFTFGGPAVERSIGNHDVYHSPSTPGFGTRGPYVLTVHDLTWMHYKRILPQWTIRRRQLGLHRDLKRARLILTPSEVTKEDLVELKGVDPGRVRVVPHGVSLRFAGGRDPACIERTLGRLGIRPPYVVAGAGDYNPRRNLLPLVRAMSRVHRRAPAVQLVILGRPRFDTSGLDGVIREQGLTDVVLRPGALYGDDLLDVIEAARVMVFAFRGEAFGRPVLQAMASGTPVVMPDTSSMTEPVGSAAVSVDPADEEAVASAMVRIVEDERLYEELRRKGMDRASAFTWDRSAAQVLDIYREAAG